MPETNLQDARRESRALSDSDVGLSLFRYHSSFILPARPIRSFSAINLRNEVNEDNDALPSWLHPDVDWESKSRFGHLCLKLIAFMARLAAVTYWILATLKISDWAILCLFYHAGPGIFGVEFAAILPYLFSNVPFRTVSVFHDIAGIILGASSASSIHLYSEEKIIPALMILTIIPLAFDLVLHFATLPRYVDPIH